VARHTAGTSTTDSTSGAQNIVAFMGFTFVHRACMIWWPSDGAATGVVVFLCFVWWIFSRVVVLLADVENDRLSAAELDSS
jgi:hypothetical protein